MASVEVTKSSDIVVVGSCGVDFIVYSSRLPVPGETLHGKSFFTCFGGKGANQAVQASKLTSKVTMIAKVGEDQYGRDIVKNFQDSGVNCDHIFKTANSSSGIAQITVDDSGSNQIIIVPGANYELNPEEVEEKRSVIASSKILICQLETKPEVSLKALQIAREEKVLTILNPAPARADLPEEAFKNADIIAPNETEAEILTSIKINNKDDAIKAGKELLNRGCKNVIVTLGSQGAILLSENKKDEVIHIQPGKVDKVVDTSGAGDSLIGSLAHFLVNGDDLETAVTKACKVASVSVQKKGTQTSYPTFDELKTLGTF